MPLTKLQFQPGVNRETTQYTNEGGWYDMDKVRFRFSLPEKIGGWVKNSNSSILGTCRALHQWIELSGQQNTGIGTNLKYYLMQGGAFFDLTPIRSITLAGDVTFLTGFDTIASDVNSSQNTIPLSSATGFPPSGLIQIGSEQMRYSGISTNTLTGVTRGVNGTTAASHTSGASVGCSTVRVNDTNHGALPGDFVTLSGAASLGGNITAAILNQEYQIVAVIDTGAYLIEARTVSTIPSITVNGQIAATPVFSSVSDTGTGGASTIGTYQVNVGQDSAVFGTGWGAGTWGRGGWGSAATISTSSAQLRIWTHDNFGEDLIFGIRDGGIYYWDASSGTGSRGVAISSLVGSQTAPTIARQVMVSDRDRHVIAFGCDDEFSIGTQDPLLIRFSDQENILDWRSLPTNTAGSIRLGSGSKIVCAIETKQQMLVFTDISLHVMQYLGPPFTFGVNTISENITIAGPNAVASVDDFVFWMGLSEFYSYNGVVTNMPCSVRDYVFNDINRGQIEKVYAATNTSFSEVWWFYPSAASEENDRYVVYNYQQNIWYYGTMIRTAWFDRGVGQYPLAAGPQGYLYNHEVGADDGSTSPASPIYAYIQSSGTSVGNGDQFALIGKVIPDVNFRNSTGTPSVTMTIKASNFPGGDYLQDDDGTVTRTASAPVQQFTNQLYLRLRGRSFFFRIESNQTGVEWRLGTPRVEVRTDGRR